MDERSKIINQHIRAQRIQKLIYIVPIAILVIGLIAYSLYTQFSPVIKKVTLTGIVQSMHQGQSLTGTDIIYLFVLLENGESIKVSIDTRRNIPFRKNAKAKIEITEKELGPIIYSFKEYIN